MEQAGLGFAGLLRQLRDDAGLTQEELADAARVSQRAVSDLERGINRTARKDTAPVAGRAGAPSVAASWAEIAATGPDLAVVAPCGYHLAHAADQARIVADALPGLPVWAIDADGIIVRPGPRLVTGVEALAAVLHPGAAAPAPPGTIQRIAGPER